MQLLPRVPLLVVLILVLVTAGCGSSSNPSLSSRASSPTGIGPPGSRRVHVAIRNFAFTPIVVHVKLGQTIAWTNYDAAPHNVTYMSGPRFTSSPPRMTTGARFSIQLTQVGTIHYYCTIHPWMTGTVVVSP